ncbi:hypothetical protein [Clostridium ihumii]|uniref:hypothetical protein n=1 Tax=Clostridium ihumii TaxID=1470356 RepID=UPI000A567032|nr:hypothetical protein [Clostridium ihumii]
MERELLKQGDKVVMHTCIEAKKYNGKIWTCKTDEYTTGEGVYKQNLVFLEGFSGCFTTEYLQKVNITVDKDLEMLNLKENNRLLENGSKQLCEEMKRLVGEKENLINALRYVKKQYETDFTKRELETLEPRDESVYSTVVETLNKTNI